VRLEFLTRRTFARRDTAFSANIWLLASWALYFLLNTTIPGRFRLLTSWALFVVLNATIPGGVGFLAVRTLGAFAGIGVPEVRRTAFPLGTLPARVAAFCGFGFGFGLLLLLLSAL